MEPSLSLRQLSEWSAEGYLGAPLSMDSLMQESV